MESFDASGSVVEEEEVVADVELVVAKNHSTCRISTLHLLHELHLNHGDKKLVHTTLRICYELRQTVVL